jgi:hypothetical protein
MDIGEIQIGWWNLVLGASKAKLYKYHRLLDAHLPPVPMHHYWWPFSNIISFTSWLPVISHLHEKCSLLLGLSSSQVPTTRFLIKKWYQFIYRRRAWVLKSFSFVKQSWAFFTL